MIRGGRCCFYCLNSYFKCSQPKVSFFQLLVSHAIWVIMEQSWLTEVPWFTKCLGAFKSNFVRLWNITDSSCVTSSLPLVFITLLLNSITKEKNLKWFDYYCSIFISLNNHHNVHCNINSELMCSCFLEGRKSKIKSIYPPVWRNEVHF